MFPDAYAFWPARRSEVATAAGLGVLAPARATRVDVGSADSGVCVAWSIDDATGGGAVSAGRLISMRLKPPSATHPATMPTVVHGIGRAGATRTSWRATSGSPQRRHLARSLLTFAPHAA